MLGGGRSCSIDDAGLIVWAFGPNVYKGGTMRRWALVSTGKEEPMHRIIRIGWSALVVFFGVALPTWVSAQTFINWETYLRDPTHSSFNNQATAITPANATALVPAWSWRAGSSLLASPTVYNGRIYIGAKNGVFYALDEATGAVVWQRFFGQTTKLTCLGGLGLVATATVAVDPSTQVPTVYVYSPDGNLYALNAGDGTIVWSSNVFTPSSTVNDYFAWSSPAVINGMVYVGISSNCATPSVRGGVKAVQQATGAPVATYFSVPDGVGGASVWSSVAVSTSGNVLVTTGAPGQPQHGDSVSVVSLDGQTLAKLDIWTVPESELVPDSDFGGSPTIFQANLGGTITPMVGACNKNGKYYALRIDNLAAGPVWTFQAGNAWNDPLGEAGGGVTGGGQCIAAAIWDGSRLFVASNATMIGDVSFGGSIRELDPATGAVIWNTGLPDAVYGSPTLNGAGMIALATYEEGPGPQAAYLIDASNGSILKTISTSNSSTFAQPVFADEFLFVASLSGKLTAYKIGP
jgi:outer membrane protein assembly factor BamB